ncbi:hypothetical protein PQQ64_25550 [Paraburkholderia graminis]|uniref:hypothetical protein n=1 Tax=Paraburkholderia graminis TaxID=60548 RepID=UPI0038B87BD9
MLLERAVCVVGGGAWCLMPGSKPGSKLHSTLCSKPVGSVLKAVSEAVFDAVPKSMELHSKQARRPPLNIAVRAAGELVRM